MESDHPSPSESLDALAAARQINEERLQRPRRYWIMVGLLLTIMALTPYLSGLPLLAQIGIIVGAMSVVGLVTARKQPRASRNFSLTRRMALQLSGFALLAGAVGGVGRATYNAQGWWWLPLVTAVVLFTIVVTLGPLISRSWARQASRDE